MTLSFFVEKQKITRTDTETPAANSNCYLKAKFEFGSDWDVSESLCPIFRRGGENSGYMPQLKDGRFLDEQNICFVPIEVLNKEGRFFVSMFDYKSGKTITTNEAVVEVCRSGPVFNSPTIYSLDLRFENENLQLTANGEAVGDGVELPKQEIDNVMSDTSENPVQNKVAKAYTDEKTKATPTDISLTGNLLKLTANGNAVGAGVELPKQEIDNVMSDTSENPVQNKVAKAYTDEKTKATPTDIALTDNLLQLTANGNAVGAGVELPKQEIDNVMSDTSENPVQNKVAKAYTDEKTKATPTDISLNGNLLQLTANGEAVGAGVTLPSGGNWRKIVDITVSAEQAGVNVLESYLDITKEDLAKINRLMFFCKLPCNGSYAIRQVEIQAEIKPSVDGTFYQMLCYKGNNFQATESGRTLYAMSTADLADEHELVRCHDASLYGNRSSENTAPREIIFKFQRARLTSNAYTPHLYVTTTNMPIVENAVVQLYVM